MSTQRLAILAAIGTHNMMRNTSDSERHNYSKESQATRPNGTQFHGNVNVLLGGAMMSVAITVMCFVCYCCHRNLRKRTESVYRQRWMENDPNMDIYSVEQCYDINTLGSQPLTADDHINCTPAHHGPPPSYETVVAMDQGLDTCLKCAAGTHLTCQPMGCGDIKPLPKSSISMTGTAAYWGSLSDISDDSLPMAANNHLSDGQILSVCDIARGRTGQVECYCRGDAGKLLSGYQDYELIRKCKRCGKEIKCCHTRSQNGYEDESNGNSTSFCQCMVNCNGFCVESPQTIVPTAITERLTSPVQELVLSNSFDNVNANIPSTSMTTASALTSDPNGNWTGSSDAGAAATALDNYHNSVNLETFNENGLIRMDMSQIIDQTGLPTYEAAIKLESSGYV